MGWIEYSVLTALEVLYRPCDWGLGWVSFLGPVGAVAAVGLISGVAIILIQKYASDQELLGRCREDLRELKRRLREAKRAGNREEQGRLSALIRRIGGKYVGRSLLPALWTVPLITVVGLWTGSRLAYVPIRPGDMIEVIAHFEDGASGFAHLLTKGGLRVEGGAIAAVEAPKEARGRQARWKVRADHEGEASLLVRFSDRSHEVAVPVVRGGGRAPAPVKIFNEQTDAQDQLQAVELRLRPAMTPAWWNVWLDWAGLYLLAAVACALGLRYALKVN